MSTRRDFLKGCTLAAGLAPLGAAADGGSRRPNLLFIFPDQFRRESMAFWNQKAYQGALRTVADPVLTPNLDRLADESVVFTQAVSTSPVCSPYRAMMMSGMYPWQNGVVSNCREKRKDGLRHDVACFTDVLATAGYETAYVGKTHWERNEALFDRSGNFVGKTSSPGGQFINPYDTYIPPGRGRHSVDYWYQCVKDEHKDPWVYSNDADAIDGKFDGELYRPGIFSLQLEADVLIDYLKNDDDCRRANRPFCAIWAPNPPHPPYWSEKDCDEKIYRKHYRGRSDLLVRDNVQGDKVGNAAPVYFANVTAVDEQIGRVLVALDESGEAENTIVVFTSDHGEMLGSQGRMGKYVLYEESFCIPLLIRFPQKIQHRLDDLMLAPVDLMPTLLGLLGLSGKVPSTAVGCDYSAGILTGDYSACPKPKSALFLGNPSQEIKGVRTDRYSFQIDKTGAELVFDNQEDPYQTHPLKLADLPGNEQEFLLEELGRWLTVAEDPWVRVRKFAGRIPYS